MFKYTFYINGLKHGFRTNEKSSRIVRLLVCEQYKIKDEEIKKLTVEKLDYFDYVSQEEFFTKTKKFDELEFKEKYDYLKHLEKLHDKWGY